MSIFEKQSTIFGGNTGMTYEGVQRKRKMVEQLTSGMGKAPKNVGEGLHAIGNALLARSMQKKADKRDSELRDQFNSQFGEAAPNHQGLVDMANSPYAGKGHQSVISALMKGVPNYARGTTYHPGGKAVVGEQGPEVVDLPEGSKVIPDDQIDPDLINDALRGLFYQEDSQLGAHEDGVQVADLAGITPEDMGVGQKNKIQDSAFAYSSLMKGLDDFEATFKDGGGTAIPGKRKDELATQHRNLQMQMKELYNLGVLNGPDLDLMNEILVNPTSLGSNALDVLGVSDLDERIPANIERVRKMMTNMVEPKLKAANIDINELAPQKELSDDDFLKELGLK